LQRFKLKGIVTLNRDLKLLFLSYFLWSSGSMMYFFIWPIYIRDLGGTAREIGLLSSLMFLTITLTIIPGGVLADRFDRKKLILITWIIATPAPLIYSLATDWRHLIPGAIIYGFFIGWPALEAYTASAAPQGRITRAFTLTSAGFSLGAVLSPLVGAYLLEVLGIRWLFRISFGFFVASTVTLFFISPQVPLKITSRPSLRQILRKEVIKWMILFAVIAFGAAVARPFVPPLLEDRYLLSRPSILMLSSLLALGEVILAVVLGWVGDRWRNSAALAISLGFIIIGIAFLMSHLLPLVLVAMFLLGGDRVSASLSRSIIGRYSLSNRSGSVFALYLVLTGIAGTMGPYVGGLLYNSSPLWPFGSAAILIVISSLFIIRLKS
jgi:MFS family permease